MGGAVGAAPSGGADAEMLMEEDGDDLLESADPPIIDPDDWFPGIVFPELQEANAVVAALDPPPGPSCGPSGETGGVANGGSTSAPAGGETSEAPPAGAASSSSSGSGPACPGLDPIDGGAAAGVDSLEDIFGPESEGGGLGEDALEGGDDVDDAESTSDSSDGTGTDAGSSSAAGGTSSSGEEEEDEPDAIQGLDLGFIRSAGGGKKWHVVRPGDVEGPEGDLHGVLCRNVGKSYLVRCNDSRLHRGGGFYVARLPALGIGESECHKCQKQL